MMAQAIYVLCMLTSIACAVLLLRSYRRSKSALLLTSSICFIGFAIHNLLLVVDLVWLPESIDLSLLRGVVGLISVAAMVFGLVWTTPVGGRGQ